MRRTYQAPRPPGWPVLPAGPVGIPRQRVAGDLRAEVCVDQSQRRVTDFPGVVAIDRVGGGPRWWKLKSSPAHAPKAAWLGGFRRLGARPAWALRARSDPQFIVRGVWYPPMRMAGRPAMMEASTG
jgi:hypothetical protein